MDAFMLVKAVNNAIVTVNIGIKILQQSSNILAQPQYLAKITKKIQKCPIIRNRQKENRNFSPKIGNKMTSVKNQTKKS